MYDQADFDRGDGHMIRPERSGAARLSDALAEIAALKEGHAVSVVQRGTLHVKLSTPVLPNQQTPHAQDEIYVIARGSGVLVHDNQRDAFHPGDLLFVAAGVPHHFAAFTDDLVVWVIFYGPDGGEPSTVERVR
jgi:mannose-6-phosphate isomerase-like protein (cupin superfamily)